MINNDDNNINKQRNDWTNVYQHWNKWEDLEELQRVKLEQEEKLKNIEDKIAAPMGHYHDHSEERKIFSLPEKEKLIHCERYRSLGNYLYSEGIYPKAAEQYQLCISYYEYCFPETNDDQVKLDELRHICLCNISLCYCHMGYYRESIESINRILRENPNHAKAYYRRAVTYRLLDLYDEALKDLKKASELNPGDSAILKEMGLLKSKKESYLKMEKALAVEMLSQSTKKIDNSNSNDNNNNNNNNNNNKNNENPYEKTCFPIEINVALNPLL